MAKPRQIVKRRKAVTNIRKITKTMQLIATARFQQAFQRATASKPYTQKISQLVEELSQAAEGQIDHPLLRTNPDAKTNVVLIITSNRGFCGSYNANVLRTAIRFLDGQIGGKPNEVHVIGKKGVKYFRFLKRPIDKAITNIDDRPKFDEVEPMASELIRRYEKGEIGEVTVIYMRFISTGKQVPEILRLLPLSKDAVAAKKEAAAASLAGTSSSPDGLSVQYDFSPPPIELLKDLLPQTVKVRLYQSFTDAAVSEQVARMVAMKAATDAGGDMIRQLSRQYNRARQTQITMELLDIVGGAEALK